MSAILHNCESWGDANVEIMEEKYRQALKLMLNVRKSSCNELPYLELGRPTLKSEIYKRQLKFYNDCLVKKDLPMQRYIIRKALDTNCKYIRHYVHLQEIYDNPEDITIASLSALKDIVNQKAASNHSRYQTYLAINPSLVRPSLYDRYVPSHKLCSVTQFRMVSHSLEIELGRHHNKPREERLCTCGIIEDEEHFISNCHKYSHIREKYSELNNVAFHEKLDHTLTPDYIYELMECRKRK